MNTQCAAEDGLIARLVHITVSRHVVCNGGPAHSPGQGGGRTKGLHIHKIPPPADELADEQPLDPQIGKGQEAELFHLAEDEQHDGRGDDGPVDGQPPVPVVEYLSPVHGAVRVLEQAQVEDHIVDPDGHQGGGDGEEHHIQDVVLGDAVPLAPPGAEEHRQNEAADDDNAVPVDGPAQNDDGHPV